MRLNRLLVVGLLFAVIIFSLSFSLEKAERAEQSDKTDTKMINRIWEEGINRSQVMKTLSYLADVIGPRIPGFQFIQDPLDYVPALHHTNQDVYDHCLEEDLIQSAIVMASFVYHAAMREEMLPRKPLPLQVEVQK